MHEDEKAAAVALHADGTDCRTALSPVPEPSLPRNQRTEAFIESVIDQAEKETGRRMSPEEVVLYLKQQAKKPPQGHSRRRRRA